MQPWFTLYFMDKWHHVMINWHLPNQVIRWPVSRDQIVGLSSQLIEVTCFIKVDQVALTKCCFSIGSRAHVRLTYWKQSQVVQKPVNSNKGLKINQINTRRICKPRAVGEWFMNSSSVLPTSQVVHQPITHRELVVYCFYIINSEDARFFRGLPAQ